MVDDWRAPLGEKIQASFQGITDKPVPFIINTRYHEDHVGGPGRNGEFISSDAFIETIHNQRTGKPGTFMTHN